MRWEFRAVWMGNHLTPNEARLGNWDGNDADYVLNESKTFGFVCNSTRGDREGSRSLTALAYNPK
jgi:hypothetical protein